MEITLAHFLYFIIYSFFGWVCECMYCSLPAKKFINRGFLRGPYCPIYGCGAVCIILLLEPYTGNALLVFCLGVVITSALEYITSWAMEALFHTKWWDYSKRFANINGRICLRNSILFGILCLVVMYIVHPLTKDLLIQVPAMVRYSAAIVFACIFLLDLYTTLEALLRRNKTFLELEQAMGELKERFASMETFEGAAFKDKIQHVLDSTDADERIQSILKRSIAKLEMPQRYQKFKRHLETAFPNQHLSKSRETMEMFVNTLNEYRNKFRDEK